VADLTNLQTKLGEVIGLAMAGQAATKKVMSLAKKEEEEPALVEALQRVHDEAVETERRGTELAGTFEGKKTAILEEARTVKAKGADMMRTYLDEQSDALDGFEFLTMAEAGEVGHWKVLRTLNERARHQELDALITWALPIQERHFRDAMDGSARLAADEDPNAPAG
jgi:hypothetical protein